MSEFFSMEFFSCTTVLLQGLSALLFFMIIYNAYKLKEEVSELLNDK